MPSKILVADDERQIVKLVEINLRKAGYDVVCACDGVEALEKVATDRPDLIILDVMMPRMNGFDVLRRLEANPETKHIPVIMLTSKVQDADRFAGWQSGVSSYLAKPFNPRRLLDMIAGADAPDGPAGLAGLGALPGGGVVPVQVPAAGARGRVRSVAVLLICPDAGWLSVAASRLRKAGHDVRTAPDVQAAKCEVGRRYPERIVLVPFGDPAAEELRHELREYPPTSHIPVLMPRDEAALDRLIASLGTS